MPIIPRLFFILSAPTPLSFISAFTNLGSTCIFIEIIDALEYFRALVSASPTLSHIIFHWTMDITSKFPESTKVVFILLFTENSSSKILSLLIPICS